ncbi:hypothetical protein K0M31_004277 [Melipona bicolor]|uniref:Uncharacterized protein n=1 Tax=Melipona bicolor TaxID=60889 RepID=A0AA40KND1_9HYME|nr:hypothetical protein K0M31_004277 [Melipona bicolor]
MQYIKRRNDIQNVNNLKKKIYQVGLSGGASYLPPGSVGGFLWPTGSNPHSTIFENVGDTME